MKPTPRFDPETKGDMLKTYPELSDYEEFRVPVEGYKNDSCIRYVILMIDEDSPLASEKEYEQKVKKAAKIAGIKDVEPIAKGLVSGVNQMITRYFSMMNSLQYELWFSLKQNFHNQTALIRSPIKEDAKDPAGEQTKKQKIAQGLKTDLQEILQLEAQIFKDSRIKKIISETASKSMALHYPEEFAEDTKT